MEDWKLVLIVLYAIICIMLLKRFIKREYFETTPKAPSATTQSAPAGTTPKAPAGTTPKAPAGTTPKAPAGTTPKAPAGTTPKAPAGTTLKATPPYIVTPTTKTGVTLRSNAFTSGGQTAGVEVNALTGIVTWSSIDITATGVKMWGGVLNTDFQVVKGPNSSQAFQVSGTFSTDSKTPVALKIPGVYLDNTFNEVKTSLVIPADNVKKLFLFNCTITEPVNTFYFGFRFELPFAKGVKKFKVFVGNDVKITLIKGNPTPVVIPLYPPPKATTTKYTIKNSYRKSQNIKDMFLDSNGTTRDVKVYMWSDPGNPVCHWTLKSVLGTVDVYTIENVFYKTRGFDSLINANPSSKSDTQVFFWKQPNRTECQWILKPLVSGQNVYTMQNVWKKAQGISASYLSVKAGGATAVFSANSDSPETHWHLNLV